jgi:tripartite-type tricarboxylate transporter receptor subunit TctC
MPELPTLNEQGVKFENYNWNAVLLPAKTPAAIVARIEGVLAAAIRENREMFISQGQEPGGENGEQLTAFLRAETERYEKVARAAKIQKQ